MLCFLQAYSQSQGTINTYNFMLSLKHAQDTRGLFKYTAKLNNNTF